MLSRRGFVQAALALAGRIWGGSLLRAGGVVAARGVAVTNTDSPSAAAARILSCLRASRSARRIGAAYLAELNSPPTMATLVRGLAPGLRSSCEIDRAEVRRALRERIQADFARGRLVQVDGWFLSETEARLCALATYCSGDASPADRTVAPPGPAR
jgi:hypothetical protein